MEKVEVDRYTIFSDGTAIGVEITRDAENFTNVYLLSIPKIETATMALLDEIRDKIITKVPIKLEVLRDYGMLLKAREKIRDIAQKMIEKTIEGLSAEVVSYLSTYLCDEMLGLGNIEILLRDENLEEVVINSSKDPVRVYHKKYGWLTTNLFIPSEAQIENYASIVGRRVGRQISVLYPLMDAHLMNGDRINSTLFPVSTHGNTLTIRKFRRKPWTITDLIKNGTLDFKTSSFLWLAMQYELSMIVGGGTASGKTTFLNVLLPFIPFNERIISIEDTRELNLPSFLHWVPMTTREPNPEGKGEVSMLNLLVNSLRMRPDRIVVGEIRRKEEAEVLFEALNTGHSVYSTLHANTAQEAYRRLTSPPIDLPPELIESLPLFSVMFRHRKLGIRRLFEISELMGGGVEEEKIRLNQLYRWSARDDLVTPRGNSTRVLDDLNLFTGMNHHEIESDLVEKEEVLKWIVKNDISTVNSVGAVISNYYSDKDRFLRTLPKPDARNIILGKWSAELGDYVG